MRLVKILLSVIVILVLSLVGLVLFLPGEKIAKIAADQVKAQTGRTLTFDGKVNFSFFPTLGVTTESIALSNADWSENGPMFTAEGAKIGVDAMALIGGDVMVKDITLTAPNILLEKDSAGQANWDLLPAAETEDAATEEASEARVITLDQLKVTNASVRYLDAAGQDITVNDLTAELDWGSDDASLDVSVKLADEPIELSADVGDLNGLIAGEITPVALTVKAAGNEAGFEGRASIAPEVDGVATANMPSPGAFLAALGQAPSDIPGVDFSGNVTLTKESLLSLRGSKISILGNQLAADADIQLAEKPYVTASVSAGDLDLTTLLGGSDSGAETTSSAEWSSDPIDASALGLFDGSIALSANSINTGSLQFGVSRLKIDVENSRAVATLQELNGYDGTVTGQFVANNRSGLSVAGQMSLAGLAMNGLLVDLIEVDRFTGNTDAQISFLGSGNSLNAIMNSLKGDGNLEVGQGTISGIDLDKLFRGSSLGGTTVFDSMTASWTITGGVLDNQDLLMDLPSVQAAGAGTIGLGAQSIDYTFTPQIKNDAGDGLAIPVRVQGPWSSPKIWPDVEAAVNQNLAEEKEALQEKAKEAVAEKLGVTTEEGQSIEDAVEQKIEEEVKNKLLNLLGGN